MLIRLVGKLVDALGDVARNECTGPLAAPVAEWQGRDVLEFVHRLRHATGDEYMGLGAGPCPLGASGFMIELATRCKTLREAISVGMRFMSMVTRAIQFELVEGRTQAVIEIRQAPSPRDPGHALSDWAMIQWHKLSQFLIGAEIWLDRTEFQHGLDADYSSYAAMFGGDCAFKSDACRLVFARSYLERRIVRGPEDAASLIASKEGYFARPVGLAKTWKQMLTDLLRTERDAGNAPWTLEALAAGFGVSSQTLRRRLKAEGICYRTLKADVRREVAMDILAQKDGALGEASLAAGYSEPNALTRALKLSRGVSTRELRDEVRRWRGVEREVKH
jgi:AraC-like DNA-binding protein